MADPNLFIGLAVGGVAGHFISPQHKTAGILAGAAVGGVIGILISKGGKLPTLAPVTDPVPSYASAAAVTGHGTPNLKKYRDTGVTTFPVDSYQYTDGTVISVASDDPASFVVYTLSPKAVLSQGSGSLTAQILAQI